MMERMAKNLQIGLRLKLRLPYFRYHFTRKGTHPYKLAPVWAICMWVAWVGSPGWVVTPPWPFCRKGKLGPSPKFKRNVLGLVFKS